MIRKFKVQRGNAQCNLYVKQNVPIKDEVDLRPYDSRIEDQGNLGSCVSNALASAYELMVNYQYPEKSALLSRLYIYYHSRLIEGSINEDMGVLYIKHSLDAVKKYGICLESLWPYDITKFATQPSPDCYVAASYRKITNYQSLYSLTDMLESLSLVKPIVIGMDVFPSFMNVNKDNPVIQLPATTEESLGGHSMDLIGYSKKNSCFLAKNSFGVEWGDMGYCWLPFEYVRLYVFDKWCFDINDQNSVT
jgi:C1A family cysteine protease